METPHTRSKFTAAGIVLVWLVLLAGGLGVSSRLAEVAVTDPMRFFPPDAPNRTAAEAFDRLFPGTVAASQVAIVLEVEGDAPGPMAEPARGHVARLAERLRAELPEAAGVVLAPTDDPAVADRLVSADGRAAIVLVQLRAGFASEEASAAVARVERVVADTLPGAGLRVSLSGHATLGRDYLRAIEDGARSSALATVALVAATLLLVYRAPLAALASLATLGIALGVASGAVTLAAELGLPVAFQSRGFLVATVYGVGTDYCLLLFARVREEGGIARGLRGSASVLVTSALAVALACSLMGFARFGLFAWSGPSLAIGVVVTLAAVMTLAPALMTLAGGVLFWPRAHAARPLGDRLWAGVARLVVARPALVFAGALLVVLPLALASLRAEPSFEVELDIPQASASEAGFSALVRHFDPARVAPLTLAVELPAGAPGAAADPGWKSTAGLDGLYQLTGWLATQPGVVRVWSATRPTGEPGLLARGTLREQLGALAHGLGEARAGAERLAGGLGDARRNVAEGRAELERQQAAIAAEQESSLLGAFAPQRFEDARRDLGAFDARLGQLEDGLGDATEGAQLLAGGVARAGQRLDDLAAAPGAARLLDRLALTPEDVASVPELARAFAYFLSPDARAARFELQLADSPNSAAAVVTLARLERRLEVVLPAFGFRGARVHATGQTAITADLAELTRSDLERLGVWVVGGVFALLVALLRGVTAPAAITAFILLSYFAALGALELGVAAGVWPGLDWKAPFFVFVLLVAIGADYGVFLLGRAREEAERLPYREALAKALTATGPVITSCGVVLAGTFATLYLSRIAFLEQVAIGITVGVLVDTVIVRPFLLPAAALLLARETPR